MPDILRAKVATFVELQKRHILLEQKIHRLEKLLDSLKALILCGPRHGNGLPQTETAERKQAEEEAYPGDPRCINRLLIRHFMIEELEHALKESKRSGVG